MELVNSANEIPDPVLRPQPEVVRCACAICGAHCNAVRAFRVTGSCPNCGSFELTPMDGAAPLGPYAA